MRFEVLFLLHLVGPLAHAPESGGWPASHEANVVNLVGPKLPFTVSIPTIQKLVRILYVIGIYLRDTAHFSSKLHSGLAGRNMQPMIVYRVRDWRILH